jgi:hypothetical protein
MDPFPVAEPLSVIGPYRFAGSLGAIRGLLLAIRLEVVVVEGSGISGG